MTDSDNECKSDAHVVAGHTGARMRRLSELSDPLVRSMLDYWNAKRGDRTMPSPNDIDPVDFPRYLPNVQLIQVDHDPLDFSYRLLGEQVSEIHGGNYRGRKVKDLDQVSEGFGRMMFELFELVALRKRPFAAGGTLESLGKGYTEFEGVYMPLSFDGARTDRILCASSYRIVPESERLAGE